MLVSRKERPTGGGRSYVLFMFFYNAHVHVAENVQQRPLGSYFSVGRIIRCKQRFHRRSEEITVLFEWISRHPSMDLPTQRYLINLSGININHDDDSDGKSIFIQC